MFLFINIIIGILYFILISSFIIGWLRIPYFKQNKEFVSDIKISIIVAARNEENNIENLIKDIINQDLSNNLYELIIINDFSEDNTASIIKKYSDKHNNISLLNSDLQGKKASLQKGISQVKGQLIATTDADCRMGKEWLSTIYSFYEKYNPKMIVAPVTYFKKNKLLSFNNLQALEFLSLIISGAGAIGLHKPIMCNAANLIFEKKVYEQLSDPFSDKYVSGDDMLFMLKIKKLYPKKILFLKSQKAIVYTYAQNTLKSFVNQRIRWTSKSKAYKDFDLIFTSILIISMNLLLFINMAVSIFDFNYLSNFLILLMIKSIPDFIFLLVTSKFFSSKKLLILFAPLQLIYYIYIVVIGFIGNFAKFRWKSR